MDARHARHIAARILAATLALNSWPVAAHGESAADWIGSGAGLVFHGPAETLRDYCERDAAGVLWFVLPSGARFELIESVDDPAIANPGDGAFHPFDEAQVRAALAQVRYPLHAVRAEVFLLPFPRRYGLESAAAPGLVLLAPGVREVSVEQQHAEFVHELGHVVQYALMPDADVARWSRYRQLRGIDDQTVYTATSAHADRPHEIFAEDFRALFGGATANYSGTIENASLPHPAAVPGLAAFLLDLAASRLDRVVLRAAANPAGALVRFESGRLGAGPIEILDVAGRRLALVPPTLSPDGVGWTWDRRDARGARVGAGVVFARAPGAPGAATRVTLAP